MSSRQANFLESERLYFKPLSPKFLSQKYLSWLNDEEVCRYLESRGNYTMEGLQRYLNEQYEKNILFWAICKNDTNTHIGNIKIDPINLEENYGEFGLLIGDKTEWGKGLAKEAAVRIITYCFEILNFSEIRLGVIEENESAVNLYKKIGFEIISRKKNCGIYDKRMCNSLRMSLKRENFF